MYIASSSNKCKGFVTVIKGETILECTYNPQQALMTIHVSVNGSYNAIGIPSFFRKEA